MAVIKFFLILVIIYVVIRLVFRLFFPSLLRFLINRMMKRYGNINGFEGFASPEDINKKEGEITIDYIPKKEAKETKKRTLNGDDYADFEEIK